MIKVSIVGVTGYTGLELYRILRNHPAVMVSHVYAGESSGKKISDFAGELIEDASDIVIMNIEEMSYDSDLYFLCLPHSKSFSLIEKLVANGRMIIDLSADFRIIDPDVYRVAYGLVHPFPDLLGSFQYGLSDYYQNHSKFVANPGCFPTSVLLALLPLIDKFRSTIQSISVVSASGVSGAGRTLKNNYLFNELYGNFYSYSINSHRHKYEIEQQLRLHQYHSEFNFITQLLPTNRGIYSTLVVKTSEVLDLDDVNCVFMGKYGSKKFIRLLDRIPQLKWVVGTNFCDLNIVVDGRNVIVTSVIDNLIKGASGQAVQNMNHLLNIDEATGLVN